ncbi:MAG: outer membrane lipoprotein carrier protein LolA [Bacteroidales bacterium]|nr:outer membrane lipoprotein carrier protein LolA [Bacteroidales bacterium]MBR6160407.1 outer membrane lipoprotein carrier protein LolA [Bacteroidales bacterium]
MKKTLFLFTLLLSCMMLQAQSAGDVEQTGDKRSALTASIEKAHKQMTSLSAQFTQRKSSALFTEDAVQKGKLNYKSPKMLRWEYTSPKAMTVIFANGKVLLKTDKGTVQNPNKMLNEMGTMIIGTINGSFLNDATNFSAKYYKNSKTGTITVVLTPVNKRIKAYYTKMTITLDAKTLLADKVVMQEVSGDTTTITFSDKKTNLSLSDSLFK